jgi:arginyl-tRNA synthetase
MHTYQLDHSIARAASFTINVDPAKKQFGDLNSAAPMVLAKILKKNPTHIAQDIIKNFSHEHIQSFEIAGTGFLNATLSMLAIEKLAIAIFEHKDAFFANNHMRSEKHYSIEFVSANPTGPLHFGHGRGGIIGDVLGNVLRFLGHQVTKEFYINDAGSQIQKLGLSLKIRCQQHANIGGILPEDAYHGEYLIGLAQQCITEYEDNLEQLWQKPTSFFEHYAKDHMLSWIKNTLEEYGIQFDVWFSEKTLHDSGAIKHALAIIDSHGHLFTQDHATWFRATALGDDKDRVVKKADGDYTYVAADIAYMQNKINRHANHLIMILGHDHHSYKTRLECVRKALGIIHTPLDIILYQLVKMKSEGIVVQMSKRTGTLVTLEEVINAVGKDVARFFYLHRKADAQLDFDIDLALKKTEENPLYYVQYAYVRINSILSKALTYPEFADINPADSCNLTQHEIPLIKKICALKELLEDISHNYQTHALTYFSVELADLLHHYYAHCRIIDDKNTPQSRARLFILKLVHYTFSTTFDLMGISKPEKM